MLYLKYLVLVHDKHLVNICDVNMLENPAKHCGWQVKQWNKMRNLLDLCHGEVASVPIQYQRSTVPPRIYNNYHFVSSVISSCTGLLLAWYS